MEENWSLLSLMSALLFVIFTTNLTLCFHMVAVYSQIVHSTAFFLIGIATTDYF